MTLILRQIYKLLLKVLGIDDDYVYASALPSLEIEFP